MLLKCQVNTAAIVIHKHTKELENILIGFKLSAARQEYNYMIKPLCV